MLIILIKKFKILSYATNCCRKGPLIIIKFPSLSPGQPHPAGRGRPGLPVSVMMVRRRQVTTAGRDRVAGPGSEWTSAVAAGLGPGCGRRRRARDSQPRRGRAPIGRVGPGPGPTRLSHPAD
jgi:hypothetical protein